MKYAIVVLVCLIAAANAQLNRNVQYSSFAPRNQYNNYNSYNPYKQNKPYSTPAPYRPYTTASPTPLPFNSFSPITVTTPAPVYASIKSAPMALVDSKSASIVRYGNDLHPDGSYSYFYETDNGIAAQETGSPRNFGGNPPVVPDVAQGSYSWISPEGKLISVTYVADENGFQPQGDAIPTSPPIPAQIARALEYTARNSPQK